MTIRDLLRPHIDRMGQTAIAKASGVPQPNISHWLSGQSDIRVDTAERIAKACGYGFRLARRKSRKAG